MASFNDSSLATGHGRFCRLCKSGEKSQKRWSVTASRYSYKICGDCQNEVKFDSLTGEVKSSCTCGRYRKGSFGYYQKDNVLSKSINELSKTDSNKLLSFSEDPSKYARGTTGSKDKIDYLESIKYKFSEGQLATYNTALKGYIFAVTKRKEIINQKADYNDILADAFNKHRSVKIRYKGSWRTIDPYSLNKTYIVAYCHFARDMRTFRLDRIQGAEMLEDFSVDKSLQNTAQSRLVEAPSYKGYRHRY